MGLSEVTWEQERDWGNKRITGLKLKVHIPAAGLLREIRSVYINGRYAEGHCNSLSN